LRAVSPSPPTLRKSSATFLSPPNSKARIRCCMTSQMVSRPSATESHFSTSSGRSRRRTLPAFDSRMPAATKPLIAVFFAFDSVSARPKGPGLTPFCSNQASAQRVSASNSPSCWVIANKHLVNERKCCAHGHAGAILCVPKRPSTAVTRTLRAMVPATRMPPHGDLVPLLGVRPRSPARPVRAEYLIRVVVRQKVDQALELALFGVVNHLLSWPSVSATSSRAAHLRYWDPSDVQKATRTSNSWCCATSCRAPKIGASRGSGVGRDNRARRPQPIMVAGREHCQLRAAIEVLVPYS
jgi:hypothetical protein